MLSVLDTVRDESGKDAAVRLVFEPRTSKVDREEFADVLLAQTSMESSAPVNLVMIGRDGRPRQKPLTDILAEWIEFRVETVRRRSQHRLTKVEDRIHILEGRQHILLNIDKVIKLIRNSDEPKPELMKAFKLSERQAEDILEIRLRQLARLEGIKIEQELASCARSRPGLRSCSAPTPCCASRSARSSTRTRRSTAMRAARRSRKRSAPRSRSSCSTSR